MRDTQQQLARIQEKELVLYTACNGVIAKHAAFFSLIAFSALTMTIASPTSAPGVKVGLFLRMHFIMRRSLNQTRWSISRR